MRLFVCVNLYVGLLHVITRNKYECRQLCLCMYGHNEHSGADGISNCGKPSKLLVVQRGKCRRVCVVYNHFITQFT